MARQPPTGIKFGARRPMFMLPVPELQYNTVAGRGTPVLLGPDVTAPNSRPGSRSNSQPAAPFSRELCPSYSGEWMPTVRLRNVTQTHDSGLHVHVHVTWSSNIPYSSLNLTIRESRSCRCRRGTASFELCCSSCFAPVPHEVPPIISADALIDLLPARSSLAPISDGERDAVGHY
jgi:hypothetical protein